jgi:hypothetical protein
MVSFATPAEMAQRSGGVIPADHPFLQKELDAASRAIRNECGWHVAPVEQVRFRRRARFPWDVWLPAMQIESVDEVTLNGEVIDVETVEFDSETGWTNMRARVVDVLFTAGFPTVPEDLVTLTLELAAGALGTPLGISREQAGAVSVTYQRVGGGLADADRDRLSAYRLGVLP